MVHSTLIKTGVLVVAAREFSVSPITEKYDARFKRRWDYYLDFAIGVFTSRAANISQFVFSKGGLRVDVENVLRSYGGL